MESGWNVWVWLVGVGGIYGCGYRGVVVRRYIDFLILLISTPLVAICSFLQQHLYFFSMFFVLVIYCNSCNVGARVIRCLPLLI